MSTMIYVSSGTGLGDRGFAANSQSPGRLANLEARVLVGPTLVNRYWNGVGSQLNRIMDGSGVGAYFNSGVIGNNFVGFRFCSGSDMLYGWAELILATTGDGTVTVNRWAYENTPDCGVTVGQTSGDNCSQPVPVPATLALLAAGAFGIRRWRAQRGLA